MSASGGGAEPPPPPARRPSRYESQKRRDWQTFTRYLAAHRPPLLLRRCSGAHVLEFLRYLDRFGKTRVHAPPCPAYGGGGGSGGARAPAARLRPPTPPACPCPLRQAWGSLDALVGRLRAAFDERHGARGGTAAGGATAAPPPQPDAAANNSNSSSANPFAARAVRLYLRDVRDAQARARGISYARRKKKRTKQQQQLGSGVRSSKLLPDHRAGGGIAGSTGCMMALTTAVHVPQPPPPPYLAGVVPFECCDLYGGALGVGATPSNGSAAAAACYGGSFYQPLLFNTFG